MFQKVTHYLYDRIWLMDQTSNYLNEMRPEDTVMHVKIYSFSHRMIKHLMLVTMTQHVILDELEFIWVEVTIFWVVTSVPKDRWRTDAYHCFLITGLTRTFSGLWKSHFVLIYEYLSFPEQTSLSICMWVVEQSKWWAESEWCLIIPSLTEDVTCHREPPITFHSLTWMHIQFYHPWLSVDKTDWCSAWFY